ncbi:MAG: hypothetical protein AUH85_10750 [Chloroflexi bacterium 13_1_40CM_4_68_4]|nr:MAG: hypothetical protein AUH85_10750 [Chloroflexi bacterium 13_1_40CM_4_68_4]
MPPESVAPICVTLSAKTRVPFASVTSTWIVEVDALSAAIGVALTLAIVFVAAPAAALVMITLQPVRPAATAESWMSPGESVLAIATLTRPFDGATEPRGFIVARNGVTFVRVISGEKAVATRLPFPSRTETITFEVPPAVAPPSAAMRVGVATHRRDWAGPKTAIGAVPRQAPAVATTLQGCEFEFMAVPTNSPICVIAPQPPVTDQVTVAPEG